MIEDGRIRVCVVGAGTRFLSGISYYTHRLAISLGHSHDVSVILTRHLLPTHFYPGRKRVGANLTNIEYSEKVRVFNGIDWYWVPSIFQAASFFIRQRPDVIVFQWWTGTVLHSYLLLALIAFLLRVRIIIEFHELLDTGEARLSPVKGYVNFFLPWLIKLSSGYIVHSEFDRTNLHKSYRLRSCPLVVIPLGPFDQHCSDGEQHRFRDHPENCVNLLYFGVIRPFKGLEDLIIAFDSIPKSEINHYWLTVVGETWEDWYVPTELINNSHYRDRITFVNRYVHDTEITSFFAGADAVVLPYHRSSASGPLQIAMSCGLPVIVTNVGGLPEAVSRYEGAILIPPRNPIALRSAIYSLSVQKRKHFNKTQLWEEQVLLYKNLFDKVLADQN